MTVRKVKIYPNKVLREKCTDVEDFESPEFLEMLQDLLDTIAEYKAVGLAAPQIGLLKRVFITVVDGHPQFFINPKIVRREGNTRITEGCLSFPTVFERIDRAAEVTIEAIDADGREFKCELDGLDAVAAQHELDHLDGILFIDRVGSVTKNFMLKKLKKFKKKFYID